MYEVLNRNLDTTMRRRRPSATEEEAGEGQVAVMHPLLRLHNDIIAFAKANDAELSLTEPYVHATLNSLCKIVAARWAHAHAELFGSRSIPGVALPSSDVDVVLVNVPVSAAGVSDALRLLSNDLQEAGWVIKQLVPSARIPVLKLSSSNQLDIDVTIASKQHIGLRVRDHFKTLAPPLSPIFTVLKKLLRSRALDNPYDGGVSSYCLLVLLHEEAERAPWSSTADYGALLVRFLTRFLERFENQLAYVRDPCSPSDPRPDEPSADDLFPREHNLMESCFQIMHVCQLFRSALRAISPDNPEVCPWEECKDSQLDRFFRAVTEATTDVSEGASADGSACASVGASADGLTRPGMSHPVSDSSASSGCLAGRSRCQSPLQSDSADPHLADPPLADPPPAAPTDGPDAAKTMEHDAVGETMRGDVHARTWRLRVVVAFSILWLSGIMVTGASPRFRHAFGGVFVGLAVCGAMILLASTAVMRMVVSRWYVGPAGQARFGSHVMMAMHVCFGAYALFASLRISHDDFYHPSEHELYWKDATLHSWFMCTPLLLVLLGAVTVTNGTGTAGAYLAGGLGQLLLLLAQLHWLAQMAHDRQAVFISFSILSTQQLGYALGIWLGSELLSGHRVHYEEVHDPPQAPWDPPLLAGH